MNENKEAWRQTDIIVGLRKELGAKNVQIDRLCKELEASKNEVQHWKAIAFRHDERIDSLQKELRLLVMQYRDLERIESGLRVQIERLRAQLTARDERIEELENPETIGEDHCPGEGRCHGSLSWCKSCGDVFDVCDAHPCDVHV